MNKLERIQRVIDNATRIDHDDIVKTIENILNGSTKSACVSIARELGIEGSFARRIDVVHAITSEAVDRRFTWGRTQF